MEEMCEEAGTRMLDMAGNSACPLYRPEMIMKLGIVLSKNV